MIVFAVILLVLIWIVLIGLWLYEKITIGKYDNGNPVESRLFGIDIEITKQHHAKRSKKLIRIYWNRRYYEIKKKK